MRLYDRRILPRLLDLAMRSRQLLPYRQRAIAAARARGVALFAGEAEGQFGAIRAPTATRR